jgi:hypothetical protein
MTIEKGPARVEASIVAMEPVAVAVTSVIVGPVVRQPHRIDANQVPHPNYHSRCHQEVVVVDSGHVDRLRPPPPKQNQTPNSNNKGGRGNNRGSYVEASFDFEPLVKNENRWRPQKNVNSLALAEKKVKSILNKMTKEKFGRLSEQMCEIPLESYETLNMMIRLVYEKAIDEPAFGDMYADLCVLLSQTAQSHTSSYVHFIESDEGTGQRA